MSNTLSHEESNNPSIKITPINESNREVNQSVLIEQFAIEDSLNNGLTDEMNEELNDELNEEDDLNLLINKEKDIYSNQNILDDESQEEENSEYDSEEEDDYDDYSDSEFSPDHQLTINHDNSEPLGLPIAPYMASNMSNLIGNGIFNPLYVESIKKIENLVNKKSKLPTVLRQKLIRAVIEDIDNRLDMQRAVVESIDNLGELRSPPISQS